MRLAFTDHYIQDAIMYELVAGERTFSELLPEGMEHSMFMYHMRKLLKAEIVEKTAQGYRLTQRGAKLYNARFQMRDPLATHRVLIQFIVIDGDNLLLTRRTTDIAHHLNQAMLPGGAHHFLQNSRDAAAGVARQRGLVLGDFATSLETIRVAQRYHGLIDMYYATLKNQTLRKDKEYELIWKPLREVAECSFEEVGSAGHIAQRLCEGELRGRETLQL